MTRVLMLGPSLRVKGGISAVEKAIVDAFSEGEIEITTVPTTFDQHWILKLTHGLALWALFPAIILFYRPSVVYIHFASNFSIWRKIPLFLWSRLFRRRVVLHAHGGGFKQFWDRLGSARRSMIKHALNRSSKIIVFSESWRDYYSTNIGVSARKIEILPNPISITIGKNHVESTRRELKFYHCGRLSPEKGISILANSLTQLDSENMPMIEFHVIGDGDSDLISEAANNSEAIGLVKFHGWLDSYELDKVRSEMDVFVMASLLEGMPMALLEAMAYGHAIIATKVGSIPEIIKDGHNGILIDPGDSESLKDAICRLASDDELRLSLGSRASYDSENFSIEEFARRLSNILST